MRRTIIAISSAIALATLSKAQAAVQTVEADNGAVYRIDAIHRPYDHNYPINVEVSDEDRQVIILVKVAVIRGHSNKLPKQSTINQFAALKSISQS